MSEIKRKTEENIEDVERISNILNRRIKKSNAKLGARVMKNKNPFLRPDGSIDLIDEFVGIDFMPYESKRKRKIKR
ncbi:hypothetical protein ES702_06982 [subsurface metagenome]